MKLGLPGRLAGPLITIAGSAYIASFSVWQDAAGTIATGLHTGWGDLLIHIRAVVFFARQGGWPRESFLLAGQPIGYSFFADLLATWGLQAGLPLALSLAFTTIVLVMIFIGLLSWLTLKMTSSWPAATLAPLLFMGFGGLSGFYTLPELFHSDTTWWLALRNLPHEITAWHDLNMIILNPFIMMLHQRAYLVGFPLFLLLIYWLWQTLTAKSSYALAITTIIALLLALVHPFTWIVALLVAPSWLAWLLILRERSYALAPLAWGSIGWILAAGGGFIIIYSLQPSAGSSFISWHPGWYDPTVTWPVFWLKNIGLYVPLGLLSAWRLWRTNRMLLALLLSAITPFIAGNLWQFAPWAWDNTKIFAPIWIILALTSGDLLAAWWRNGLWKGKAAVVVIIPLTIFSGGLEIARVLAHRGNPLVLSTPADAVSGQAVQNLSTPDEIILTAPSPNHPIFMYSGQPSLVAYEGWLWSQGWQGTYEERVAAMKTIYQGGPTAAALLQKHHIALVVIGPPELQSGADQLWFDQRYPIVVSANGYTIYRISR